MPESDLVERITRLEQAKIRRPSMADTLAMLPAPPSPGDFSQAKMLHDEKRRQERIAEAQRKEDLDRRERERLADEARLRAERNAPKIAKLTRKIEAVREQRRPLEAQLSVLDDHLHRLRAERNALL